MPALRHGMWQCLLHVVFINISIYKNMCLTIILTNNLKVSTLYKKLCQRFSLLLCKEEILSQVCLIYVICFCNLRMWKDLNKSCLTRIKLCVSVLSCMVLEPILLPLKLWVLFTPVSGPLILKWWLISSRFLFKAFHIRRFQKQSFFSPYN